jgi:uncharacterized protein
LYSPVRLHRRPSGTIIGESDRQIEVGDGVVLEGRLAAPIAPAGGLVLCHPHPLYGGDMDNPVIVRAAEVCVEANVAALRFNFRGVGGSGGRHRGGREEQDDVRAALAVLAEAVGQGPLGILGYSFGSWVASLVGIRDDRLLGLALIAPPLSLYDFGGLAGLEPRPLLLATGSRDPYCPLEAFQGLTGRVPWATARVIEGADHFFLGRIYPLGEAIRVFAAQLCGA